MSEEKRERPIRRILVGIDTSASSLAALEAALALAADHGAKVEGLFVEDLNLIRLAQLPFARQVISLGGHSRQVGLRDMEQQLRIQADEARGALAESAYQYGVRWSFRVVRGDISAELIRAARDADLIILGRSGLSGTRKVGSTTRTVLTKSGLQTLILERGARLARPVVTVYDDSEGSKQALERAMELAQSENRGLTVLIIADDEAQADERQNLVAARLTETDQPARFRHLIGTGWAGELRRMQEIESCLLVVPALLQGIEAEHLVDLLDNLTCPVFVVR